MSSRDEWINRIMRYPGAAAIRLRVAYYRALGAHIGRRSHLKRVNIPRNPWDVCIGDDTYIDDFTVLLSSGPRLIRAAHMDRQQLRL